MVKSAARRAIVQDWIDNERATERQACRLIGISRSVKNYISIRNDEQIKSEIKQIKSRRRRYGILRVTAILRRKGFVINHKRVRRLCYELGLMVRRKLKPKPRKVDGLSILPIASKPNQVWAMDFVSDKTVTSKAFRSLTIIDIHTRISPGIYVDYTMKDCCFLQLLERLRIEGHVPETFILDNGTEFTSGKFTEWCKQHNIQIFFIEKGCPTQNAYIESFNGRFRDECLNQNRFNDLTHARRVIEAWRNSYNFERPHSSLDYQTPMEYLNQIATPSHSNWS